MSGLCQRGRWIVERMIGAELESLNAERLGRGDAFRAPPRSRHTPTLRRHSTREGGGAKAEPEAEEARSIRHEPETFRTGLRCPL